MIQGSERLRLSVAALGASIIVVASAVLPAEARAAGRHAFTAELAAPSAAAKIIAPNTVWRCEGAACAASAELTTSPRRFCAQLASSVGILTRFTVNGAAFDAPQLERCNAAAAD